MTTTEILRHPVTPMAGEGLRRAHLGTLGPDGEPLVDGLPWRSAGVAARVADIGGRDARLVRCEGAERFEGRLALNGFVIAAGDIAVGDVVVLVRGRGGSGASADS